MSEDEERVLEKIGELRNVLALGLPVELLPPLARRARLLLATARPAVLPYLPAGSYALVALHEPSRAHLEAAARLCSPAGIYLFTGDVDEDETGWFGVPFKRVGRRLILARPITAPRPPAATVELHGRGHTR